MSSVLNENEIEKALNELDNWNFKDDKINKEFSFSDFREAVAFLVRLSFEAEDHGHHPEIFNVYNTVKISLSTHDAGDKVTDKDIKLAKAIDTL